MKPKTLGETRTPNLVLTRDLHYLLCYESISQDGTLYTELNHLISLEEKLFTLNIYVCIAELSLLVEVMGFEPTTICVQSQPSIKLAYTPINWRLQGRYKITSR